MMTDIDHEFVSAAHYNRCDVCGFGIRWHKAPNPEPAPPRTPDILYDMLDNALIRRWHAPWYSRWIWSMRVDNVRRVIRYWKQGTLDVI
jgi:hypothetical protein